MLTFSDIELWIYSLFSILEYEFNIDNITFSLLDVFLCMGGFFVIITFIKRIFLFYMNGRR